MTEETGTPAATTAHDHDHDHGHDHDHHHGHDHDHDHDHDHGPKPLRMDLDALTEEAAKQDEEEGRAAVPHTLLGREKQPGAREAFKFEIAAADFAAELDRYFGNIRKEIVLPGFRKGKAPVKLLRLRMGEEGDREALLEAATNAFRQVALAGKLALVAPPRVTEWSMTDGQPATFTVVAELEPEINLATYKGLTASIEVRELQESAIDAEIDRLRGEWARWEDAPEGHKLAEGDMLIANVVVTGASGQEIKHLCRENQQYRDYRHELPGEVGDKLTGLGKGETITTEVTEERQNRRGETVSHTDTYTVTVVGIKTRVLPVLDDEFAKDIGDHQTVQDLRDQITKDLKAGIENNERRAAVNKLTEALIEKNPFEVPPSLVANLQYQAVMEDERTFQRMGLNLASVVGDPDAYLKGRSARAEFELKQSYIFRKLSELENLAVSDEDVEKEIERIAEQQGRKPLAVRARFEAEKRLDALRESLVERKLVDFLLANNTIEKVPAKEKSAE